MAAGVIPKPGSESGPCIGTCRHKDCAANRADADATCEGCDDPIGYETPFYRINQPDNSFDGSLWHSICLEREKDRIRKKRS